MNFHQARFNMVEQQIRPWGVSSSAIIEALNTIHREDFVPPQYRSLAFSDVELPLPAGQIMLTPKVQVRMLQDLDVKKTDTVLHIGAGTGYVSALLGVLAQDVTAYEIVPDIAAMAQRNIQRCALGNVRIMTGNGFALCKHGQGKPIFDAIALSGAVENLPAECMALLKPGGRLFAIVGEEPVMRASLSTLIAPGQLNTVQGWDTVAPYLTGGVQATHFVF